ncbi:hypothetical protein DEA8626_02807 [Defluviimonas aquaemixtae]|uniref:Uncharacterized protein n=1 Tax=Albidovulum aquaemixtae TaxID=1542388 RepID=A0A2R8BK65_9RHOB|nr:hypothetical protein [Defluviimonas aquaemixtae]SPH23738.1 hypothetical protein DEA8626_02807 [Defluviimonas aquaemixtae]
MQRLPFLRRLLFLLPLDGGQGQGCNFEREDQYSDHRRIFHQAVLYGFLMCFASTSAATLMLYILRLEALYSFFSMPKLLGVPCGILLLIGCAGPANLKTHADPTLGAVRVWGGEMAIVPLLGLVGLSGLASYAAIGTALVAPLLAVHLGSVLTFFLPLPYTKFVHGHFRFAALTAEEGRKLVASAPSGSGKRRCGRDRRVGDKARARRAVFLGNHQVLACHVSSRR